MQRLPAEIDAPAWLHGASAFTTIRTRYGKPLLWPQHWQRLAATADVMGLPLPPMAAPTLEPWPWGLLRITVAAGGVWLSHRVLEVGPPRTWTVRLTDWQVHPQLGRHKTGNYLPYRLAMAQAQGADEVWLRGQGGSFADGSRSGLLIRRNQQWIVPCEGLPSVTRAHFLQGQAVTHQLVTQSDLAAADGVWMCGSGIGIVPVARIEPLGLEWQADWLGQDDPALCWPSQKT